jgi:hypothetical protein
MKTPPGIYLWQLFFEDKSGKTTGGQAFAGND